MLGAAHDPSPQKRAGAAGWERAALPLCVLGAVLATVLVAPNTQGAKGCPGGMASILGRYCIDRYEASMVVVNSKGKRLRNHSPYFSPSPDQLVMATSRRGVVPQAYLTQEEATIACESSGKRLCTDEEWVTACKGREPTQYPYGDKHIAGRCNDAGESSLLRVFGKLPDPDLYHIDRMNDPRLNRLPKTLAKTGAYKGCKNSFGLYDMVGNLHEWTSNRGGTFRGGYYLDTHINGEGCGYQTTGHNTKYSDYSIGFRCCSRPGGEARPKKLRSPIPAGSPRALDFERKKRERARKRAAAKAH